MKKLRAVCAALAALTLSALAQAEVVYYVTLPVFDQKATASTYSDATGLVANTVIDFQTVYSQGLPVRVERTLLPNLRIRIKISVLGAPACTTYFAIVRRNSTGALARTNRVSLAFPGYNIFLGTVNL